MMSHEAATSTLPFSERDIIHDPEHLLKSLEPTASSTRPQPTHQWEQTAAPQHASAPYLEHNGITSPRASSYHDELDSLTSAHNSGCRNK